MSLRSQISKIHFIGIGGIGMSGIAEILCKLGHQISGSDLNENKQVQNLKNLGASIQIGHSEEILKKIRPDVVVYSNAIKETNPEWRFAKKNNIPIIRRAEMLAEIMNLKRGIAIAGSHGKTTTTGLVSLILKEAELDPSIVIGGQFKAISSNASLGGGRWLITEADESDGSFLKLNPEIAVVTNIDREHVDHYQNDEEIIEHFYTFIDKIPFYGRGILCSDNSAIHSLRQRINKACYYYGFEKEKNPDFLIQNVERGAHPRFEIQDLRSEEGKSLNIHMKVPGKHNILNACAAAIVGLELGISTDTIERALHHFEGVDRRFEVKGNWRGHRIIDDYAHHPTEIRATLEAAVDAKEGKKPIVVFQPHRYSRCVGLWDEFHNSFENAAELLLLPIYPGGEKKEDWMKDKSFSDFEQQIGHSSSHQVECFTETIETLKKLSEKHSIEKPDIFFFGAGDIYKLSPMILNS